jgi:2-methylcitrate dehydratase PrpD
MSSGVTRRALIEGALGAAFSARMAFAQNQPMDSAPLALQLARLLNRTKFSDLPPSAIKHAKVIIASTLASAAPGTQIGSARIIRDLAKEAAGKPEASIWFDGAKLPLTAAARVNAMLSDSAASDDSDLRNVAHTGTCLTAVGLAIGEHTGASGPDVLTAMVTGYEAAGRIGQALNNLRPGMHASIIVAFGGVVAASKLLKLTDEQMANAISMVAASMGGLIIGTNSWAREYYAGNAAQAALNAALAAGRGYVVNSDFLESKGGFVELYGKDLLGKAQPAPASVTREMGPDWDIVKYLAIKLVPGAHALHASAEAAAEAARKGDVKPDDVAKILVSGPAKTSVQYNTRPPKDMIEAIHSLAYFVATSVADRDFGWVHVTPEKIHNPVMIRLLALVEPDPAPPAVNYEWNWGGTVTIVTKSGARFTATVDAPKGSGPRGIEWSDVDTKYRALIGDSHLPVKRGEEILKTIHDFEQVKPVAAFTRLLS